MSNYSVLQEFTFSNSIKWFKEFFSNKLDELKSGLLEAPEHEMMGDLNLDVTTLNTIFSNIKQSLSEINNFKDLEDFIEEHTIKIQQGQDEQISLQNELVDAIKENPSNIHEKITEIIFKMQVGNIVKTCSKALEISRNLNNKLGIDTSFSEIDIEDINYIIDTELSKSADRLKNWSTQNPNQAENYKDELKILLSDEDIKAKKDAIEIIEHYFSTIIGNEIDDEEISNLTPGAIDKNSKIVIFNQGIIICEELYSKIHLSHQLLTAI
ncbi:hypothetical protein [Spiroplasma culicicola]|uniref:Uncharacterized protein n=1 Tax=Spiroplasma culicicola AES-1 TaxID=1276246 RepID=W6A7A5_9MOLU|nr:hypothetical protein [Spiroplasma culicicola]AHI52877.1 hypothetical protein SCULI_v1c05360 [Spiroplasma culicicola AES-1]